MRIIATLIDNTIVDITNVKIELIEFFKNKIKEVKFITTAN